MKKFLLLLLTLVTLGFAASPVSAQTVWNGTADISWYDASQTSFDISTPEQLAGVSQLMTNMTTTFNGMTLNLTADIWLNSDNDSTNNWVPIGGYASASGEDSYSYSQYAFQGTFKGNGHIIYNMYCEKSSYFQAGLFGCVTYPCTIDSIIFVNPVVKANGMSGTLVGYTQNDGNVYISNCLVINGRVEATNGNNNGGILGGNWKMQNGSYWTYLTNCGFTGHVHGKYLGGLVGNGQKIDATNVYFAGTMDPVMADHLAYGGILGHADNGKFNFTNAYSNITTTYSSGRDATVMTETDMQTSAFATTLGDAFMADNGMNNGYPILSCMAGISASATEICQGESVTLTGVGYDSYSWTPGGQTTQSIAVTPTTTTTYTMTGTTLSGTTGTHTITITVFPSAVVTAEVVASADGQTHATLNQSSFTVGCGSSDNISLVVTPETNYRVCRVTLNGNELYGDTFGEGTVAVSVNPGGTLGTINVYLSNTYTISILELLDTGDTLHLSNLVQPYGTNGVFTATAGGDQTFAFNNTARYVLQDAEIDGVSQGAVTSYDFTNIHENHSIVVTYVDSCGIAVIPFFDDFETATSSSVPECYERITPDNYPYAYDYSYYSYSGTKSIYFYSYNSGTEQFFILPKVLDTVTYPLSNLMLKFYARVGNVSNTMTIGSMTDPTDASTFTALQTVANDATNTYQEHTVYLGNAAVGDYIAIKGLISSYYTNICIDDITVDFAPQCSPITNLAATDVYGSNATLTWDPTTVGEVSEYNIVITDNTTGSEDVQTSTETTYLLTGLNETTSYTVGVFTSCTNGESSDTVFVSFTTPCNNPVNYSVGDATTTNSYLPTYIYYGNTYSQQIVTADVFESTPNDFASISVKDNTTSQTTRACDIYLAHVPDTMDLAAAWILPSATNNVTFTQVFSGNVQFGTGDWVKIDFDTVFSYNGTDNLLVVFSDHTNSYTSSHSYDVVSNSNTTSMARYAYRDGSPYDAFNPGVDGTPLSVVNTFRFSYCDASSCISPNTLTASNLTENSADIAWVSAGSESSWEVEYKASTDADWTSDGTVSTTSTTLYGLTGNTLYSVRVRALCSGNEESPWSESISFRTECASITQLPYSEDFEDATAIYNSGAQENYIVCWDRYASNASHYVYIPSNSYAHSGTHFLDFHHTSNCFNIAIMPAVDATINVSDLMVSFYACRSGNTGYLEVGVMSDKTDPTTFVVMDTIDLSSYNTYEYGLQQVSFENYMDNGQYVAFRVSNGVSCGFYIDDVLLEERPNCMYPTNLHSTNVSNDEITLAWTETGSATQWNILYGLTGFDPETEGTTVPADANPYTITGLQNATSYDFYVQADCGGMQSQWTGPIIVKTGVYNMGVTGSDTLTTCGVFIYDDGGVNGDYSTNCDFTLVIYPADPNAKMSLTGTSNTESNYDYLYVYDGVGTTGTQLAQYSGNQTVNVLSTTGPLTLKFTSDYTVVKAGLDLQAMCVTCFPPTNVAVSNVTTSGAEVSWSGNVSEYGVYVISSSDTNYYTTTDTFYVLNNLIPSSSYNVQVQAICSVDETSSLSTAVTFNTSCDPITITADSAWTETFEGYTGSGERPFICWETPVHPNGPFVYCGHAQSCHSGENSAEFKGSVNVLVLPTFTNNLSELRLSFWATAVPHPGTGVVEVGYMSDAYDTSTFVFLEYAGTPGPRGNQEHVAGNGNYMGPFDFNGMTAPAGSRIALRYTNTGSATASWNLDDFTVELIPNCPSPVKTSVQASNVDAHSATITFTDNDTDHNSWTVFYREHSADPNDPWLQETTSTTSVTLVNLDPETEYDVYVITNCTTTDLVPDATNTIQFTTTVACPAPTNVTITNIDLTSATVSWDGNADSYTVTCGDFTTTVTGNTTNITGLTSATNYTVSVVADCGADGSSSATTATFATTICALADQCAYTFNLTDSWGDGWNGASITVQQNGVNVATVGLTSGSTATEVVNLCDNLPTTLIWNGGNYDSEASFTVNGPDGTEIYATSGTPSGTLTTFTTSCNGSGPVVTDPTVATQAASNIAQTTATLNGTITNPDNVTITEMGFEWMELMGTDYTHVTVTGSTLTYDLTNLTPNTDYIFKAFITYNGTTVYGNDLIFTTLAQGQPTEPSATTLPASAVTQTTATLNGTISNPDNVTITAQGFEWKQASATSYTTVNATGTTMASPITGLTANTDYTYRAFVTTANGTYYGVDVTFTTLNQDVEPCDVPTGLTVSATTDESITITWDANANVSGWNIQYRPAGGTLSSATSSTNSYTINGLQPETSYEIQVQANCGDGNLSEWSSAVTGTTTTGIDSWLANSVSLYPNPAKEVVNVQCTMNNVQIETVEVFDVYGKLVNTVIVTENPTRINISGLADGMYFVRVTTEEGMVTKTFVKR